MKREKTAVEFLYEFLLLKLTNDQQMQFEGLFQQAKEMEKNQIEKAFDHAQFDIAMESNEYYKETYGDEKTQR